MRKAAQWAGARVGALGATKVDGKDVRTVAVRVGMKVWRKAGLWGSRELRLVASRAEKRVGTRAEKKAALRAWASGS